MQVGENILNHTNTFGGGMNKDSSVLLQPDGTYRDLRNFQLINSDGNNYTIKDAYGNRVIFTLPKAYNAVVANFQDAPMPIGFISFPDKLIVEFTNNESSSGGYGEIGVLFLTNIGQSIASDSQTITVGANTWTFDGYVPLYVHEQLKFSKMYKIEGFAFPENDDIGRVYWTDNFNEPRVLDTLNPIYTTYYATGALTIGTDYMVISGAITHNAIDYGIGLTAGNIFTAVNTNYTVADGQPLVIKYFPYQLLNWTPSRALGNMCFNSYGTGVKRCGSSVYFYRLGKRGDGYFTSWSYGNYPIHVGVPNSIVTANTYTNFVGDGSATTIVNSAKSIKLDIINIDTNFDIIQLACAEYDQTYDTPYAISIVQEATITGASMTLEDFGNQNLGNLTFDDVTLFPASILRVKTLTTDKNYNIPANITERIQPVFDKSSVTMTSFEYPMPVHGNDQLCGNDFLYFNVLPTADLTANPAAGTIIPWSRYNVTGGTFNIDYVEYPVASGNKYGVGQPLGNVFVGSATNNNYTVVGSPVVRPCVSLSKYVPTVGSPRANTHEIKTGFWDYKDPLVNSLCRGYWSHEVYRFGIMFYDKKGNPFYVNWLGDYQMPLISTKGGLLIADNYAGTNMWSTNPSLMSFSGIRITQEVADAISGFSIVRAPRDVRVVAQGLVMQNTYVGGAPNLIFPNDYILNNYLATISSDTYTWISPDNQLINFPEKTTIGVKDDKMEEACWTEGIKFNGVYYRSGNNPFYDVYTKQFTSKTDGSSGSNLRSSTIVNWLDIDENVTVTNVFGDANTDYRNDNVLTLVQTQTDTSCYGGGVIGMAGRTATGGKKAIIRMGTFTHFGQYPAGYTYTASGQTNPNKIIMNYVKELTNPYGGTGESAVANTLYISTGHFQPINPTVLAETLTIGGYYEFNSVEVGGGDCFTTLVDYGYGLQNLVGATSSIGFYFPCESNSNYTLRRGKKISNLGMGTGVSYPNGISYFPVVLEDYSYNAGYSSEGVNFEYPALPVDYLNSGRFPSLMRYSLKKTIGEIIDNFRIFLINNRIFTDGQLGEINNVKAKGDYIYYWQNHGVGASPILERIMSNPIGGGSAQIADGGVLPRFDTINTKYGNQHQWSLTDTIDGWIWFDMRNKDVCVMGFGGQTQEITVPTGMKSYFSEVFLERLTAIYNDTYLNSQTYDASSDRPLMGTGIVGVYDPKNKMTYLTFKFRSYYKATAEPIVYTEYQKLYKDFTIGFSHIINKFIGFYDKMPAIWHNHNQSVLSANNPKNLDIYYGSDMIVPTPVEIGNVIKDGVKEYICYVDGVVSIYATPPSASLFTEINTTNKIYIENEENNYSSVINGYEYNKLYGRVVDNSVTFVVNPKVPQAFSVDNQLQVGNVTNFNQFYYATETKSTSDTNVKNWNRNYQLIDEGWNNNLPISTTGKLSGFYNLVTYIKKNWSPANVLIATTNVKILERVRSFYKLKF